MARLLRVLAKANRGPAKMRRKTLLLAPAQGRREIPSVAFPHQSAE
jgi:hypothetical protein